MTSKTNQLEKRIEKLENKTIEVADLDFWTGMGVILGLISFISLLIFACFNPNINLQHQIDQKADNSSVVHKYCHNETAYGDTVYASFKPDYIIENIKLNPNETRTFRCVDNGYGQTICMEILEQKQVCTTDMGDN